MSENTVLIIIMIFLLSFFFLVIHSFFCIFYLLGDTGGDSEKLIDSKSELLSLTLIKFETKKEASLMKNIYLSNPATMPLYFLSEDSDNYFLLFENNIRIHCEPLLFEKMEIGKKYDIIKETKVYETVISWYLTPFFFNALLSNYDIKIKNGNKEERIYYSLANS